LLGNKVCSIKFIWEIVSIAGKRENEARYDYNISGNFIFIIEN